MIRVRLPAESVWHLLRKEGISYGNARERHCTLLSNGHRLFHDKVFGWYLIGHWKEISDD